MIYDLMILGGGPAGYNAAEHAAAGGLATLLIEENVLGGACLNEGCIPTKTLLYSAKMAGMARHGTAYGVATGAVTIDHPAVIARKDRVVTMLVGGVEARLKAAGVAVVRASAVITGRSADGYTVRTEDTEYTGKRLLIATGAQPVVPPIPGIAEGIAQGYVCTSREALALTKIPERLVVIGGGVIGLEMASYYCAAGSKVTIVEMLEQIGGPIDSEIADILAKSIQKEGVALQLGCTVTRVQPGTVTYKQGGSVIELPADLVLLAIGRRARTLDMGLENIKVETERGAIVTDEHMQTSQPGVYAAGDCNGKSMLAHTAYREGEVAINHMLGRVDSMDYDSIPGVIYTNPEAAFIGLTEQAARERGLDIRSLTLSMRYAGRYVAENEGGGGIAKFVVDNKWNTLIGVHMIANHASEIITAASAMVGCKLTVDQIKRIVFPHPTVGEILREAAFML